VDASPADLLRELRRLRTAAVYPNLAASNNPVHQCPRHTSEQGSEVIVEAPTRFIRADFAD
jgi:hypothetical protein